MFYLLSKWTETIFSKPLTWIEKYANIHSQILTNHIITMNKELLLHIGLSENEADVYLALLEKGMLSVAQLAKTTKSKRANLYNILTHLAARGAVEKVMKKGVAYFQANDPQNLLILAEQQEEQLRHHREALELVMPSLKSLYQFSNEKPSVSSFEGIGGLKKIYDDINKTKKNILLLRSVFDNDRADLDRLVHQQIERQVEAGIRTRVIAPLVSNTKEKILNFDKKNLVERRIVSREQFTLPAQIIVYENKVAVTDLKGKALVSTLIENESIAQTFRILFEYIWSQTKKEDQGIRKKLKESKP